MIEVVGDILSAPDNIPIAHCISSDLRLGAGVALAIEKSFGCKKDLFELTKNTKVVVPSLLRTGRVFHLVTKDLFWHKPTYKSLFYCIDLLIKEIEKTSEYKFVAIPKIGCGLDKLDWSIVRDRLEKRSLGRKFKFVVYHK